MAAVGGVGDGRSPVGVRLVGVGAGPEHAAHLVGVAGRSGGDERSRSGGRACRLLGRACGEQQQGDGRRGAEHFVSDRHDLLSPAYTYHHRRPGRVRSTLSTVESPPYASRRASVHRLPGGATEEDRLAVEEPLEIRIGGRPIAVTMRTPGHDEELALGFCLTEGLHPTSARPTDDLAANVVEVDAPDADLGRVQRSFYTSSSCGVCGKGALEAVAVEAALDRRTAQRAVHDDRVAAGSPEGRPGDVRPDRWATRDRALAPDGAMLCVREDVGRHNAMDKVLGWALREGLVPLAASVLCVSGRLSFELVQKAAVAGCPILVAVGAPSSLAVELAADRGVTLVGFVRDGRATLYTEPARIAP